MVSFVQRYDTDAIKAAIASNPLVRAGAASYPQPRRCPQSITHNLRVNNGTERVGPSAPPDAMLGEGPTYTTSLAAQSQVVDVGRRQHDPGSAEASIISLRDIVSHN